MENVHRAVLKKNLVADEGNKNSHCSKLLSLAEWNENLCFQLSVALP